VTNFSASGFALVCNALARERIDHLEAFIEPLSSTKPGTRCLLDRQWCQQLASEFQMSAELSGFIPQDFVAIQCTLFEKTTKNNWLVPVHQDLSVPVAQRQALAGWGTWTQKEGTTFVQPPVSLLEQLVAVRLHLDDCSAQDGPLAVVPGSHRQGIISPELGVVLRTSEHTCTASVGDALVFKPLLLHRSSKATGTSRRRVLHLLFGPPTPGDGISWRRAA
jgi:hypothetical protein